MFDKLGMPIACHHLTCSTFRKSECRMPNAEIGKADQFDKKINIILVLQHKKERSI